MKKFISLLALTLCSVGAWAEAFTPIEGTKYTLTCSRGGLTVNAGKTALQSENDAKTTRVAYDAAYQFVFVENGGNYYMKNVGADKFVTNTGGLVADIASASAISFRDWEDGTYQPYWEDQHNLNLGGSSQMAINNYKTKDAGNQWTIEETTAPSYNHITDFAQLNNDKAYVLVCDRGQLTTNTNAFGSKAVLPDPADAASKFAIIRNGGAYSLWSINCSGFVKSDKAISDENPETLALTKQDDNKFLGVLNGKGLNVQSGGGSIMINTYVTPDAGNKFNIYEVGNFDSSVVFTPIKNSANNKLDVLANVPVLFATADVTNAQTTISNATSIDDVSAAVQTLYATANDKKIVFYNTNRDNKYMVVVDAVQLAGASAADGRSVFQVNYVAESDGQFTLKNLATGRYIANTPDASNRVQLSTTAGKFTIKSFGTEDQFAFISVNPADATHNSLHLDGSHNVVAWEADNNTSASVWVVKASEITDDQLAAGVNAVKQQAYTKVANSKPAANMFGEGLGKYSKSDAYNTAEATVDAKSNDLDFETILALETTLANNMQLNMPLSGTYLRMKSKANRYITIPANHATATPVKTMAEASIDNIFYYADSKLLAYATGLYLNGDNHAVLGNSSTVAFSAAVTGAKGYYAIKPTGNHWYDNGENQNINHWSGGNNTNCEWVLEAVESLPIKLNELTGKFYGTINLPVAVTIPEGLKAYSAVADGETLSLTKVVEDGVLAANTPVVLYAESNVTELAIADAAGVGADENELAGTVAAAAVTSGENYVLSGSNGVGFYKYNNTTMPGFKAYLPASAKANANKLSFRFEDVITAIEAIESSNSAAEIFDLQGRRLSKAQKGMNIINGHKVLVK